MIKFFIVNFEHISHLALMKVSVVKFEYVIADWVRDSMQS